MRLLTKLDTLHQNLSTVANALGDREAEFEERLDLALASLHQGKIEAAIKQLESLFSDFECVRKCIEPEMPRPGFPFRLRGVTPAIRQLAQREMERSLAQRIQEIQHDLREPGDHEKEK